MMFELDKKCQINNVRLGVRLNDKLIQSERQTRVRGGTVVDLHWGAI